MQSLQTHTHLCRRCQDRVIKHSLANVCPLALQPRWAEYKHLSALLFLWICDAAPRCQSLQISVALRTAQTLWLQVHGFTVEELPKSLQLHVVSGKTPVTVCGCRPMQMCCCCCCSCCCCHSVFFWQVSFSLARGLGEMVVRYTNQPRPQGCKTSPESCVLQRQTYIGSIHACIWTVPRGAAGGGGGDFMGKLRHQLPK